MTKPPKLTPAARQLRTARIKARHEGLHRDFKRKWNELGGPFLREEYRFHPTRKWRFDFALPHEKVAIEIDGGVWIGRGHAGGGGFIKDRERDRQATLLGWKVYRLTPKDINFRELGIILKGITRERKD